MLIVKFHENYSQNLCQMYVIIFFKSSKKSNL